MASAAMTGLGMGLLGLANSDLGLNEENHILRVLPLISVMMAAIGYQFGMSPIVWSYAGTNA